MDPAYCRPRARRHRRRGAPRRPGRSLRSKRCRSRDRRSPMPATFALRRGASFTASVERRRLARPLPLHRGAPPHHPALGLGRGHAQSVVTCPWSEPGRSVGRQRRFILASPCASSVEQETVASDLECRGGGCFPGFSTCPGGKLRGTEAITVQSGPRIWPAVVVRRRTRHRGAARRTSLSRCRPGACSTRRARCRPPPALTRRPALTATDRAGVATPDAGVDSAISMATPMRGCCDAGQVEYVVSKHVAVTSAVNAPRSRDCRQARRPPGARRAPTPARAGGRPCDAMRTPAPRRR